MIPTFKETDGGRSKSTRGVSETRDCTVRALVGVTGKSYDDAHVLCANSGRRSREGMTESKIKAMFDSLNLIGEFKITEIPTSQPQWVCKRNIYTGRARYSRRGGESVSNFLSRTPKSGRYYLTSTKHAFAVVDGVILDMGRWQPRAKMCKAWRVEIVAPASPKAQETPSSDLSQADINAMWARLMALEAKMK